MIAGLVAFPLSSFANPTAHYLKQAEQRSLASQPAWSDLLHYRPGMVGNKKQSQADDPAFFISPRGATDPHAELDASIKALFAPAPPDQHFSCRFPARTRWLTQSLDIPPDAIPPASCPALDSFRQEINAQRISLIFASTYLNSPSSMFGHTFLRIDNSKQEDANLLLSNTISYAADASERDNELMFAYRGIFGGYPGVTSIVPYYEKLKQYIDMENRDIWEFELNFSQQEIDQLVDHAWELKDKNFDYYFFDENCAYRLLTLMDVARPGTDLIADVSYQAIPADTVRWVVDKDLVKAVGYRPSTSTLVQSQIQQLSQQEQHAVLALVRERQPVQEVLKTFPDKTTRARILDTSYEYSRYDTVSAERSREETAALSHRLLMARARLGQQPSLPPPQAPAVRDDQGHDTVRLGARAGQVEHRDFIELDIRPAYHDLTDIPDGYPEGTQLRFLATRLRYWTKDNDLDLEELTLIDINSLSPRDRFFSPVSWKVAVGAIRSELVAERPLAPYLKGGAGMAVKWFDGLLYSYLQGSLQVHRDLDQGYALGPGLQIGWVRQRSFSQTLIQLEHEYFMEGNQANHYELSVQQGFRLGPNRQWMGSFSRRKTDQNYQSEWRIEFRQFL
ncbi:MAG: DUF4105 domain-containing protein [Ketobacteraceae bacterium]|nr:DUF4105 domain-containing protein [Ketobacteraceae bacterium]